MIAVIRSYHSKFGVHCLYDATLCLMPKLHIDYLSIVIRLGREAIKYMANYKQGIILVFMPH